MTQGKKSIWTVFFTLCFVSLYSSSDPKTVVHFPNTDFELEVIRVNGKQPGPTLLIFGGIHGDEEGGFCSAELLAQAKMKRGNLVIVPRVNFAGIMRYRREIYGDMNRKFIDKEYPNDPDYKIVKLLKKLISEADIFINQHDAHGFHRKKYISKDYNPFRYGQSLIVDTGKIESVKLGKTVDIDKIGHQIVDNTNREIKNPKHHFCYWNQNSIDPDTKFKDMQKSATYYAVTRYKIPAFGLETSKNLPNSELKIKYQLLMICKIMDAFEMSYEFTEERYERPVLYWLEFLKNDRDLIRVNANTNIRMDLNDRIRVLNIHANYKSGLSFNILDWKDTNDFRHEYKFTRERTAFIRKNHVYIGKVRFKRFKPNSVRKINIQVADQTLSLPNWGVLKLFPGKRFKILNCDNRKGYRFDVKGFNGKHPGNDGNRWIAPTDLLTKYSFKQEGRVYFVRIYKGKSLSGGFQIQIEDVGK